MKRTTLMVDETTLHEARRLSGERTYSATVDLHRRARVSTLKSRSAND